MAVLYDNMGLAQAHLRKKGRVAEMVLPEVDNKSLIQTAVELFSLMEDFRKNDSLAHLLSIAADDVIDETEREEFDAIVARIRAIIQKGMGLQRYCSARLDDT